MQAGFLTWDKYYQQAEKVYIIKMGNDRVCLGYISLLLLSLEIEPILDVLSLVWWFSKSVVIEVCEKWL